MQVPFRALPHGPTHASAEEYVVSLLDFITTSSLHQALCGGVHILDFLTSKKDLYTSLLPSSWREWFADVSIYHIIDLLLREDLAQARKPHETWRDHILPPESLLEFITQVRDHTLDRGFTSTVSTPLLSKLDRTAIEGMNAKKQHEVINFANFVSNLVDHIGTEGDDEIALPRHSITHLIDFGSGQNYLGRRLAGPMYEKHVVALESRPLNIEGARKMDEHVKLAKKTVIWRNKKMWKTEGRDTAESERLAALTKELEVLESKNAAESRWNKGSSGDVVPEEVQRRITYIEHVIQDGNLDDVTRKVEQQMVANGTSQDHNQKPGFAVISLHSCGNLVHHGLRSLVLNPAVKAVAMIGCCYNLCTERHGATFKLPNLHLRAANQRLMSSSLECDSHGFPMSERFLNYQHAKGQGIRFNITARSMSVQAPANWTRDECESFFTRHFYRALLQRVFLDTGFVAPPVLADEAVVGEIKGWIGGTEPIIIGRLSKACYKDFVAYVRGAAQKISKLSPEQGVVLTECIEKLSDDDIAEYEKQYMYKKHELCVAWTLMAFASQVVESAIVVDRWQFLMEQESVATAWVQTVFEYRQSPRNLVVVGIKK